MYILFSTLHMEFGLGFRSSERNRHWILFRIVDIRLLFSSIDLRLLPRTVELGLLFSSIDLRLLL